jgi:tRNA (cytidine/uridine-2'-O-)-methyltransferase
MHADRPQLVLLYPDIPQNLGAVLRLAACMGIAAHIIEPCGFVLGGVHMRRAGMDYISHATLIRHHNWDAFLTYRTTHEGRLILVETDGTESLYETEFAHSDYLIFGSESAGTPAELYGAMDSIITIPMREGMRSLNLAMSAGMVASEAYRQLRWPFKS